MVRKRMTLCKEELKELFKESDRYKNALTPEQLEEMEEYIYD